MVSGTRIVAIVFSLAHSCAATSLKDDCIGGDCNGQSTTSNVMLQRQSNKNKQVVGVEQQRELAIAKRIAERVANQTKLAVGIDNKRKVQKDEAARKAEFQRADGAANSWKHRQSILHGKQSRRLPPTHKKVALAQAKKLTKQGPAEYGDEDEPMDVCTVYACEGGCVLDGTCYREDPKGNPPTQILCDEYRGTWCGGSDGGDHTLPPVQQTVCATEADFIAANKMHGWCEFVAFPTREMCWERGCSPYEMGEGQHGCHCEQQESCEALGGEFQGPTCEQEMRYWEVEAMNALADSGTCDGIVTSWQEPIASAMKWIARQCCANYPATVCNPEGRVTTTCKNTDDFTPDVLMHGWCEHNTVPERELCQEAGCHFWGDEKSGQKSCHCENQPECDAVGGRYKGQTCLENAMDFGGQEAELLRQAEEQGSCAGLSTPWGESLEQWANGPSQKCCRSSPANICRPNARAMTPCKDDTDFDAEATLHEWCEFTQQPHQELCEQSGCSYWSDEWSQNCHCGREASCTTAGGTFRSNTCADDIGNWNGDIHAVLQEAHEAGTCEGRSTPWDESLPNFLRWPAQKCCRSYPATLCEPEAKIMHPCINDYDFMPENSLHEWCDYGSALEPSHETCEDAGFCHCHKPDACAHFGGQPHTETCGDSAIHQEDLRQEWLEAREQGTCENQMTSWGESLADATQHTARKCCASYPNTFCSADGDGGRGDGDGDQGEGDGDGDRGDTDGDGDRGDTDGDGDRDETDGDGGRGDGGRADGRGEELK